MYGCSILLKIEKYLRQDLYNIKENLVEIKKCLDDIVYKLNNKWITQEKKELNFYCGKFIKIFIWNKKIISKW